MKLLNDDGFMEWYDGIDKSALSKQELLALEAILVERKHQVESIIVKLKSALNVPQDKYATTKRTRRFQKEFQRICRPRC